MRGGTPSRDLFLRRPFLVFLCDLYILFKMSALCVFLFLFLF